MLPYSYHPSLLLRTPVYAYQNYDEKKLAELLTQPFFQKAIYFSSEAFYNELKKVDFELLKLDNRSVITVKKYFNRMCFRPTPFGLFSAFGVVMWGEATGPITFAPAQLKPKIRLSYAKTINYVTTLNITDEADYKLNTTIYKTGKEYRFLRTNNDNAQIEFIIDSIKTDAFFEKVIQFLSTKHNLNQISNFVSQQANCTQLEADKYTHWLKSNGIISGLSDANITGQDYLERILKENEKRSDLTYADISSTLKTIYNINFVSNLNQIPNGIQNLKSTDYYVNLTTNLNDRLDKSFQQAVNDGLACINKLTKWQELNSLTNFAAAFTKKFDKQIIPLLYALDPEVGVGYNDLAVEEDDLDIVKNIMNSIGDSRKQITWSKAHAFLFNKWKHHDQSDNTIMITDDDLKELSESDKNLPPTISVMFRVVGNGRVLIENAGGACATSLIGRFTPFDNDINNLACDMASSEALYNPDIIFAEIAHVCHEHTANIDRRKCIYPYEIPVLVQSTLPAEQQILLNDLWVSVINGKIVLQSKKHNKRVVPRLSSAFNYTRNDLAVFRFLCDLQRAEIKTSINFNLSSFFPDLDFYPRVEYKNAILQLAIWNFKKATFEAVLNAPLNQKLLLFNTLKIKFRLPQYIALTQNDHQLVFDLCNPNEVFSFLDTIKTLQNFTVKEYLLPNNDDPVLTDTSNNPHINQFITSLFQKKQTYDPVVLPITKSKQIRKFIPGDEWLYVKLYCHPIRTNELLTGCIATVINTLYKAEIINQWFFIRYNDPDHHIRLRLKTTSQNQQQVLNTLKKAVNIHISSGTISNYAIDTYERELERYSAMYINDFENAFCTGSNLILAFLKSQALNITPGNILQFALSSVNDILWALGLEGTRLITFLDNVFASFEKEFKHIGDLKYQLDIEYRKQKYLINDIAKANKLYSSLKLTKARAIFISTLTDLKKKLQPEWKDKWIADLVHMHLNRLFNNNARKQEMAVYYFLLKSEKSAQARAKNIN